MQVTNTFARFDGYRNDPVGAVVKFNSSGGQVRREALEVLKQENSYNGLNLELTTENRVPDNMINTSHNLSSYCSLKNWIA